MDDNDNYLEKSPEIVKPDTAEAEARYDRWNTAMASDVPEFVGEDVDLRAETATPGDAEQADEFDSGLAEAAALINYGLDAAARKYGVETVIQGVKTFDASGSTDPIGDLYQHLGVETAEERKELRDKNLANKDTREEFQKRTNLPPKDVERTREGANKAIDDMKELISEVEGADPRYEALREGARAAGKGYFEYAVGSVENRGLTDLFEVLREQKEESVEQPDEAKGAEGETKATEVIPGVETAEDTPGAEGTSKEEEPELKEGEIADYVAGVVEAEPGIVSSEQADGIVGVDPNKVSSEQANGIVGNDPNPNVVPSEQVKK